MSPAFLVERQRGQRGGEGEEDGGTHLGRIMCRMVPAIARPTKSAAVATYAQPRNGFLPPIHDTVEITTDLVPWYDCTG